MYRYIKSNGQVFHQMKNLTFLLEFSFYDHSISSTEEIQLPISTSLENYVFDYLDNIAESVSIKLSSDYPIITGETKPNKKMSSVYIPTALRDQNLPYRLKVGLEAFADINRISYHSQEDSTSQDIQQEREKTISEFKEELKDQINRESRITVKNLDDESTESKQTKLENYSFPEDFSIYLITSESKESYTDMDSLISKICELIYSRLVSLNAESFGAVAF